jgi:hypothetical protein
MSAASDLALYGDFRSLAGAYCLPAFIAARPENQPDAE